MPELRLNLVTRDWVIIATERAQHPADFKREEEKAPAPHYLESCPFCPGNESKTSEEYYRLKDDVGWKVRVVANRHPAVVRQGERLRIMDGAKRAVSGVGIHEVIIETPVHNTTPALFDAARLESIIKVYKERFTEAYRDQRVEHVIIFKNNGEAAGTSIVHPHTQLIAIPVIPVQYRDRIRSAMHYFDETGSCIVCDCLSMERKDGRRIISETEHFISFIPYAALSPFHTWIFPRRHSASFSGISEAETKDFTVHLKTILSKLYWGLEDPDYNFVIKSSRPRDIGNEYSHWYLSVVPRVSKAAGFELGTGMYINTCVPEESAAFLRSIKPE